MRPFIIACLAISLILIAACSSAAPTPTTTQAPPPATTAAPKPAATAPASTPAAKPPASTTASPSAAPKPATTAAPSPAPAAGSAAEFFKNNQIQIVVPSGAGGGTDYGARLFASYWTAITGGRAIVINKPGGGGLTATGFVYKAKPDALTIGMAHHPSQVMEPWLWKDPGVEYDPLKMQWIGFYGACTESVVVGKQQPYNSMADLQKAKNIKFGAGGGRALREAIAIDAFQLDAKVVSGYESAGDLQLGVTRGEITGFVYQANAVKKQIDAGAVKPPLVVLDYQRTPWFKDSPAITELVKLTPAQDKLLQITVANIAGKSVWVPPGVPEDRVKFLRDAFDKIMASKGFLQQIAYEWPSWVPPTKGVDMIPQIKKLAETISKEDLNNAVKLIEKYVATLK